MRQQIHWGGREEAQFYKIAHFTTSLESARI